MPPVRSLFLLLLLATLACGCQSTVGVMPPEMRDDYKTVAVAVSQEEGLYLVDHTLTSERTPKQTVVYYNGVVIPVGVNPFDEALASIQTKSRADKSLGGNPNRLANLFVKRSPAPAFPDYLRQNLEQKFEVRMVSKKEAQKSRDYIQGADLLIEVNYLCGIAAYIGENSSPVVLADIKATDLDRGSVVLEKAFSSDISYRMNNTVEGFMEDNGSTFLEGINEAEKIASFLIAQEFGIESGELTSGIHYDFINYDTLSCKKPFNLTQDCSNWSGAKRKIIIEGLSMKIAGSDCGKAVIIMPDTGRMTELKDGLTLGLKELNSGPARACLDTVRPLLEARGFTVKSITKVPSRASVRGYVLVLDGDAYSYLKGFTAE